MEEQLHGLEGIRRLLLRVEVVMRYHGCGTTMSPSSSKRNPRELEQGRDSFDIAENDAAGSEAKG